MRKRVAILVALVLAGSGLGCNVDDLYLASLFIEGDIYPGEWTQIMCVSHPLSAYELLAGDYWIQGDLEPGTTNGRFPRKFQYMIRGYDALMQPITPKIRGAFPINKRTGTFDTVETFRQLEIPMGGQICYYGKVKGMPILHGMQLSYFNFYRMQEQDAPSVPPASMGGGQR